MATKEKRLCLMLHKRHQVDLDDIRRLGARLVGPSFRGLSNIDVVRWLIREKKREWQIEVDEVFSARIEADKIIEDLERGDPSTGVSL